MLLAVYILSTLKSFAQTLPAFTDVPASKVLVVYNDNPLPDNTYTVRDYNNNKINDSKELAEYYQQKRNIPASNMLAVYPSWFEIYTDTLWAQVYWDDIIVPIKNKLTALGDTDIYYILLMEGIPTDGKTTTFANGNSFDNSLIAINSLGGRTTQNLAKAANPILESSPGVSPDKGQFNHKYKVAGGNMYPVSRITSWNIDLEKNVIDMSLYGDKYLAIGNGYYNGPAYLDTRYGAYDSAALVMGQPYSYNSYSSADKGMALTENYFKEKNIPYKHELSSNEIGASDTMKFTDGSPADSGRKTMLYAGWYNYYHYYNKWEWIPGSFACDLNSLSGGYISYNPDPLHVEGWLSRAFAHGLTCGTGVYGEPLVSGHSRSNIFLYYFLNGYSFIESAIHAEPLLKFQGAIFGDPLYNPFRAGKLSVKDIGIEPSVISYDFLNDSMTNVHLDYNPTIANPEVVKARLYWGTSAIYTDTIKSDSLYFAHHTFRMKNLKSGTTYHYKICVADPVGNTWCSLDQLFKTDGTFSVAVKEINAMDSKPDVFPNPSSGNFQISYTTTKSETLTITIINQLGQELYNETNYTTAGTNMQKINMDLPLAGIYILKIASESSMRFGKIIVQ